MFGLPAGWEIPLLLIVLLLLFGGSRLAGVGKGAGQAIREFKDEVKKPVEAGTTTTATTSTTTVERDEPVVTEKQTTTVRQPGDPVA